MKETGATQMLSKTIDVTTRCFVRGEGRAWPGHFDIEIDYVAAL